MFDVVLVGPFPEDPERIRGGVQASVYGLFMGLTGRKDVRTVTVFSMPSVRGTAFATATVAGRCVIRLSAPLTFLSSSALHVRKVLRAASGLQNPICHIHGTGLLQAFLAVALSFKRSPYLWTLHGIRAKETLEQFQQQRSLKNLLQFWFYSVLELLLLRLAPQMIVDTGYVARELRRKHNVSIVPQGIFIEELSAIRGENRGRGVILSVGVFSPRKGHLLLLEAFAEARKACPDAKLIIVGGLSDLKYHQKIVRRATELGLSGSVEFRPSARRESILELLGTASIFALHSQEESQGIALCEALAAGLPIVATDVGGIPYVVTNGQDGLLVSYGDIAGFANALIELLRDDGLRAQMSLRALESAGRYDWKDITEKICGLYGVLCEARHEMS